MAISDDSSEEIIVPEFDARWMPPAILSLFVFWCSVLFPIAMLLLGLAIRWVLSKMGKPGKMILAFLMQAAFGIGPIASRQGEHRR
jgi:ABC-type sulfate transport system permease subunit